MQQSAAVKRRKERLTLFSYSGALVVSSNSASDKQILLLKLLQMY